jgi:hypothetical protein
MPLSSFLLGTGATVRTGIPGLGYPCWRELAFRIMQLPRLTRVDDEQTIQGCDFVALSAFDLMKMAFLIGSQVE